MTEKVTVCRALLAEFVQKHKIEEEKEDFEMLRGRW